MEVAEVLVDIKGSAGGYLIYEAVLAGEWQIDRVVDTMPKSTTTTTDLPPPYDKLPPPASASPSRYTAQNMNPRLQSATPPKAWGAPPRCRASAFPLPRD